MSIWIKQLFLRDWWGCIRHRGNQMCKRLNCDLIEEIYCLIPPQHHCGPRRRRSHLAWTSGLHTPPVIAASYADVSVKTVLCLQRQGCQARTVRPSPTRLPVPSNCLCGFVLTADVQWRRRTDTLLWNSHWGWVTCLGGILDLLNERSLAVLQVLGLAHLLEHSKMLLSSDKWSQRMNREKKCIYLGFLAKSQWYSFPFCNRTRTFFCTCLWVIGIWAKRQPQRTDWPLLCLHYPCSLPLTSPRQCLLTPSAAVKPATKDGQFRDHSSEKNFIRNVI